MLILKTVKPVRTLNSLPITFADTLRKKKLAMVLVAPLLIAALWMLTGVAHAQTIYKCPTAQGITPYTNDKAEAGRLGCTPLVGGNVTVVEGTKVQTSSGGGGGGSSNPNASAPVRIANAPQAGSRVDAPEQRARDSDSRAILESELKKAEAKQNELLKDYNNGDPEKQGIETRNNQKYIDRVADLKATIARNDADIAGIKREIARLPK